MGLELLDQACIYRGFVDDMSPNGRYIAAFYVFKEQDSRGGFPNELTHLLKLLNIPYQPHWHEEMRKKEWKASYHIRVRAYESESDLPPISKKAVEYLATRIKNEEAMFLLQE